MCQVTSRASHVWKWKRLIGGFYRRHDWLTVAFGVVAIDLTQIVQCQWFHTNEIYSYETKWRSDAPTSFEVNYIKYVLYEDCYTSVCPFQLI